MSVIGDILEVVAERVESVTEDNDYTYSINSVTRPTKPGAESLGHLDAVVKVSGDPVVNEALSSPGNPPRLAFDVTVLVAVVLIPDDNDATSFDEIAFQLGTEIQTAIMSPTDWHQFDGNAINAKMGALAAYRPGDDTPHGIGFEVTITYRVSENNLNTLRG